MEVLRDRGYRVLTLDEAVELEAALPLRWSAATEFVRTLRLVEKVRESEELRCRHRWG